MSQTILNIKSPSISLRSLMNHEEKLSTVLKSMDQNILPEIPTKDGDDPKAEKSFRIHQLVTLDKIIGYLYNDMGMRKHFLSSSTDKENPLAHLELLL